MLIFYIYVCISIEILTCIYLYTEICTFVNVKGQLGVPLTVYPWYLLCSLGILGDYNP